MCDPMTIISTAGGFVMDSMAANAAADEQNARAAQNRANAINAQNSELNTEQESFVQENRALAQEAYDEVLADREGMATMINQAADSGVWGISVNEGLFAQANTMARRDVRFQQELATRKAQFDLNMAGLEARTQNQINQVQTARADMAPAFGKAVGTLASDKKVGKKINKIFKA